MANYTGENLAAARSASLQVSDTTPISNQRPLPKRPTHGEGAAGGALAGAGAVFEMGDPYAILLLPVFIPIGAVFGAASVPNDEKWAGIVADWKRAKAGSDKMVGWIGKNRMSRLVEAGFAEAVNAGQGGNVTCGQVASRSKRCNLAEGDVVLKVELLHSVLPFKGTRGGFLTGEKKRTVEEYLYTISAKTLIQEVGTGKLGCYVTSYSTSMAQNELVQPDAERRLADLIRRQAPVIGQLLAYDLFTYLTAEQNARGKMINTRKSATAEGWRVGFIMHGGNSCETLVAKS